MIKIVIDKEKCIGCGACWVIAPGIFIEDKSSGKTTLSNQYILSERENKVYGEIPRELYDKISKAEKNCPTYAISIEEQ